MLIVRTAFFPNWNISEWDRGLRGFMYDCAKPFNCGQYVDTTRDTKTRASICLSVPQSSPLRTMTSNGP